MKTAKKLLLAAIITSITFLAELIGGFLFGSLSLVADSIHVILDVAALLFSYGALQLALRESNDQYTYGYHRLEIFTALLNGILLTLAIIYIIYEVIERLINPILIIPLNTLIIAGIGISVNFFSMKLLGHQHEHDINVKSAYLHVLGDTLASIAVIIGTLFILLWNIYWIDPLVALIIIAILIQGTYRVLKESTSTLMQKSPIDINKVKNWLRKHPKIKDVHDLHIWRLCSNIIILTCHVVIEECDLTEISQMRAKIQEGLIQVFNIQHTTIQFDLECDQCKCDLGHNHSYNREKFTCPID
ncbi:MAG: cation diffusion facilitator family transporter [Promethearchaeota archaeon]